MSEPGTATLLVAATGEQGSLIIGVATAREALQKLGELRAEGLATTVFDGSGPERSIEELRARVGSA